MSLEDEVSQELWRSKQAAAPLLEAELSGVDEIEIGVMEMMQILGGWMAGLDRAILLIARAVDRLGQAD